MAKYPFEVPFDEILRDAEGYVDAVFSCLESEFLKKMILATRGKVFTLKTLDCLIEHTRLGDFRAR